MVVSCVDGLLACVNDSTSGVDFFTPGVKVYTQLAVSGKRS